MRKLIVSLIGDTGLSKQLEVFFKKRTKLFILVESSSDITPDVVVDCHNDLSSYEYLKRAIAKKQTVVSANKALWTNDLSNALIKAANTNNVHIYLNALGATANYNELLISQELNHKTITQIPQFKWLNMETENIDDVVLTSYIIKDVFKILMLLPENKIILDQNALSNYDAEYTDSNQSIIIIKNFLPDEFIVRLQEITQNTTIEEITKFGTKRQWEKFKQYCETFLYRTDYENVLEEGVVQGGLDPFQTGDYIQIPEDINRYFNSKIKKIFVNFSRENSGVLMKEDQQIQFFPDSKGYKDMALHYDIMDNMFASYGLVYYLNDNYEGGVLYFPNKNIEVKPPANSLVIFRSSTKDDLHGVKHVTSGTRYSIATFVWLDQKA